MKVIILQMLSMNIVYIAHLMTPFSPNNVTIFTNCEEVKLTFLENIMEFKKPMMI